MGFQHSLAMIGGIVSVPLLLAGPFDAKLSREEQEYLVSAGLIVSGLLSFVQIRQLKFGNSGYILGTGLVSVLGTSFTFVPIARTSISYMMADDTDMGCVTDADCTNAWADVKGQVLAGVSNKGQCNIESGFCKYSGQEAYGAFLGTCMCCAFLELLLSLMPLRYLRRMFPPIVTGVCVLLIGIGLTGTGLKYWGGGAFCADHAHKRNRVFNGPDLPGNRLQHYPSLSPCASGACVPFSGMLSGICAYSAPTFDEPANITRGDKTTCESFSDMPGVFPAQTDVSMSTVLCAGNGEVLLPFGSPQYIGMGCAVFVMLLLLETFSSPFIRNCEVALALLFGFVVAAASTYSPPGSDEVFRYVTDERIREAPGITFLWVHTFPLSIYGPAVVPLLICYIITTVESIGDITATAEASQVPTDGERFDARVQGGLTSDAICSFLSALATSPPNTTFSQNSGVIAMTRCANKRAGYCCAAFLVTFGVLAKISAIVATIPNCVRGGMTTFLFVNIALSGLRILGPPIAGRRNRFIVAAALTIGIGVATVPQWATNALITGGKSSADKLARDSAVIVLSTPYCIGTLVAMVLHAIMPEDAPMIDGSSDEEEEGEESDGGKPRRKSLYDNTVAPMDFSMPPEPHVKRTKSGRAVVVGSAEIQSAAPAQGPWFDKSQPAPASAPAPASLSPQPADQPPLQTPSAVGTGWAGAEVTVEGGAGGLEGGEGGVGSGAGGGGSGADIEAPMHPMATIPTNPQMDEAGR